MLRKTMEQQARDEQGTVIVLVAVMMVTMLGLAALVVDGGLLLHTRRQVTTIADSAALAGAIEYAKVVLSGGTSEKPRPQQASRPASMPRETGPLKTRSL